MLEHYGFPWGNKRKLQWALEASNKALEDARKQLRHEYAYIQKLTKEIMHMQDVEHKRQYSMLMPMVDHVADLGSIVVGQYRTLEMPQEQICITMALNRMTVQDDHAENYMDAVVNQCAHSLARKVVDTIRRYMRKDT